MTHSGHLERWLGAEQVANVSNGMRDYPLPIAVAGVPGNVMAMPGGGFRGRIRAGYEASAQDRIWDFGRTLWRGYKTACRTHGQFNTGFTSLSDLINAVTVNQTRQELLFLKANAVAVTGATSSLWHQGSQPSAAGAASAAPAGDALTSASTGALIFTNPSSGGAFITTAQPISSVASHTALLHDRTFQVAKTMNSTVTEAVTGVPTRYTNTTAGQPDYAGGSVIIIDCSTNLAAGVHNWTVCKYTNQAGTTGQTLPSVTGNSSNVLGRLDMPINQWFCPMAANDVGVSAITQMQCSAAIATGAINFAIIHPLAWFPCPTAQMVSTFDGINTAFNFVRVFNNACLAFLDVIAVGASGATFTGSVSLASN